jgi:hypothetical protein
VVEGVRTGAALLALAASLALALSPRLADAAAWGNPYGDP